MFSRLYLKYLIAILCISLPNSAVCFIMGSVILLKGEAGGLNVAKYTQSVVLFATCTACREDGCAHVCKIMFQVGY